MKCKFPEIFNIRNITLIITIKKNIFVYKFILLLRNFLNECKFSDHLKCISTKQHSTREKKAFECYYFNFNKVHWYARFLFPFEFLFCFVLYCIFCCSFIFTLNRIFIKVFVHVGDWFKCYCKNIKIESF